ncbi:flavodoxin domain-containing protein [Rhodopirellula sallentina]|uniref:Flavodoxin/nitric oxide synthase n=1 Tax=Rhodopirellula sallentina SM41 TaxID=1263870 RepID=M5UQJ0_9BACT|nr:flavodoxin domain-containing protein [Rhodopirellula sallentina]EMI58243.1 flavodoxin/nitric oxide synthase [Rhodopirellula sallentina SM41]
MSRRAIDLLSVLSLGGITAGAIALLWWTQGEWWVASPSGKQWAWAIGGTAAYLVICLLSLLKFAGTRASTRNSDAGSSLEGEGATGFDVLVLYASQTGTAEELATETVEQLGRSGVMAELAGIEEPDEERWSRADVVLIVASTAGEGEPPDHAYDFAETSMSESRDLSSLRFGVLALGDREYDEYCAFGRQINRWLLDSGASPLFDMIEVDDRDEEAIERWETLVGERVLKREKVRDTVEIDRLGVGAPVMSMSGKLRDSVSL